MLTDISQSPLCTRKDCRINVRIQMPISTTAPFVFQVEKYSDQCLMRSKAYSSS